MFTLKIGVIVVGLGITFLLGVLLGKYVKGHENREGKRERKEDREVIDFRHDIGLDFTGRKVSAYLNKSLIHKQGIKPRRYKMIEAVHAMREHLFDIAVKIDKEDAKQVHVVNVLLFHIEICLQDLWNFEKEVDWHSWWYQVPGCTCPFEENKELLGVPNRTVRLDCPFHGDQERLSLKMQQQEKAS